MSHFRTLLDDCLLNHVVVYSKFRLHARRASKEAGTDDILESIMLFCKEVAAIFKLWRVSIQLNASYNAGKLSNEDQNTKEPSRLVGACYQASQPSCTIYLALNRSN
jgi:hypothetical protein